jgi:hypothetical protein
VNVDDTVHDLLLSDALEDILITEVENNWVAAVNDLVKLDGDGVKEGWETIPLRSKAIVSLSQRERILECALRVP